VVVRADLNGHLKALKDYFLLAKGDFFQVSMQFFTHEISLLFLLQQQQQRSLLSQASWGLFSDMQACF